MKLYHTSPNEITKIDDSGRFGEFLCFASDVYEMAECETTTYSIEIADDEVIDAGSLFFHEDSDKLGALVDQVKDMVGCDTDTAEELISQRVDVHEMEEVDPMDAAEISWDIQAITARAAQALGFRAVEMEDEQGAVWLVAMAGREAELVKE